MANKKALEEAKKKRKKASDRLLRENKRRLAIGKKGPGDATRGRQPRKGMTRRKK